jgi:uncharacterized protein (DUF697 family)
MAGIKDLANVWNTVKEIDLRPLADAAMRPLHIALVSRPGTGRDALAEHMRRDPSRPDQVTQTPIWIADLDAAAQRGDASPLDLVILLLDATAEDDRQEQDLARSWSNSGVSVLVLLRQFASTDPQPAPSIALSHWVSWGQRQVISGSLEDPVFLSQTFVPAVLKLLPDQGMALARQFPLFRAAVAHELLSDTCFSNAAYALSTGVAEIVPIFDIPLNIADMFVLTKAQAFLAYKLGLALGLSTRWQDYVAEFGSVLGGGFLWRQIARSLIGLIPAWGIVPKVAVAYAGTYVVGNVVYHWYLTGRHITTKQMRQLYVQAFARGKNLAQDMAAKLPRPKRKPKLLKPGKPGKVATGKGKTQPSTLNLQPPPSKTCPNCGKTSAPDAQFCQYCGQPF